MREEAAGEDWEEVARLEEDDDEASRALPGGEGPRRRGVMVRPPPEVSRAEVKGDRASRGRPTGSRKGGGVESRGCSGERGVSG